MGNTDMVRRSEMGDDSQSTCKGCQHKKKTKIFNKISNTKRGRTRVGVLSKRRSEAGGGVEERLVGGRRPHVDAHRLLLGNHPARPEIGRCKRGGGFTTGRLHARKWQRPSRPSINVQGRKGRSNNGEQQTGSARCVTLPASLVRRSRSQEKASYRCHQ